MSNAVHILAYAGVVIFLGAVLYRIVKYIKTPIHVRWELYPVAHEEGERAEYGGSYLEDVDWWKKEHKSSMVNELKVMIPEILLLKACYEHNRPLWYLTYPFHAGLYILTGVIGLLLVGAIAWLAAGDAVRPDQGLIHLISQTAKILGPIGLGLTFLGALGLFVRRLTDPNMKRYSAFSHYFNLVLFMAVVGLTFAAMFTMKEGVPYWGVVQMFLASLIGFKFAAFGPFVSNLFLINMLAAFLLVAYIPVTHMSHFFMKYFLYHDIRWGDEANIGHPETDAKIAVVLNYPVTWAAEHVAVSAERKTWAEVATYNPAQPDGEKAE